jgi:hypothetical protein
MSRSAVLYSGLVPRLLNEVDASIGIRKVKPIKLMVINAELIRLNHHTAVIKSHMRLTIISTVFRPI